MPRWIETKRVRLWNGMDEVTFFIKYNPKDAVLNTYHFERGVKRCPDYRRRKVSSIRADPVTREPIGDWIDRPLKRPRKQPQNSLKPRRLL